MTPQLLLHHQRSKQSRQDDIGRFVAQVRAMTGTSAKPRRRVSG